MKPYLLVSLRDYLSGLDENEVDARIRQFVYSCDSDCAVSGLISYTGPSDNS